MSQAEETAVSPRLLALALPLLIAVPYVKALDVGFVWDDRAVVLGDPAVTVGRPLVDTFTRSFWPESDIPRAFFRPITTLSYRLDWLLHGENPTGFHLTNVVLHIAAALLLFVAARRLGARPLGAFAAALAWALLPRLTEAVTWISGRTDVLAAVLSFGALAVWPWRVRSPARVVVATLAFVAGLLAKEVTLAVVIGVVLSEIVSRPAEESLRKVATKLAPLTLGLGGYALLRRGAITAADETPDGLHGLGERLQAAATALGHYVAMTFDPFRPRLQIGLVTAPSLGFAALGALGLAAFVAAAVLVVRRVRDEARAGAVVGLAIAAVAIGLVVHLIAIPVNVSAADRFMYFPMAGLALALAVLAPRMPPRIARGLGGVAALVAVVGGFFVHQRSATWADELSLWAQTTREIGLESPIAVTELGNVAFRAGAYASALEVYSAAANRLASTPGSAERRAAGNVAASLGALGKYDDALVVRRALAERYAGLGPMWLDVARAELHALHFVAAERAVDTARAEGAPLEAVAALGELVRTLRAEEAALREAGPTAPLDRRARFEARAGREREALLAWRAVIASPGAIAPPVLDEAAAFFVERGTADDLRAIARRAPEPRYVAAVALREEADRRRAAADEAIAALSDRLGYAR